jgi:hypothetical protein
VDAQNTAIGEMQPREHDDLVTDAKIAGCLSDIRVEHEPCLGRALIRLARRIL